MQILTCIHRRYHGRSGGRLLVVALASVALTGCKKDPVVPQLPAALIVVQGPDQTVQAGTDLPAPIVVRLLDVDGVPIPNSNVSFTVALGGGTVNPASGPTDENGEMRTKWSLGPLEVMQKLSVSAGPMDPVEITAYGLLPSDIVVAQGTSQVAKPGAALPNAIVVRIVGPGNVPMKGITVGFQVMAGGGLINPQSGVTNASGEVQTRWTLGPSAGTNTLQVVSGNLQAVTITAVGQ